MIKLYEITSFLEQIAPLQLQEDYDNSGLIYGSPEMEITSAVISLDLTEEVLEEAISFGSNLIISHHPIIFRGIKKFHDYYVDRTVAKAIKNDIAIYAIHTNLDNVLENGVNEKIAQIIGLNNLSILSPKVNYDANQKIGSGLTGTLEKSMTEIDFLAHLKSSMQLKSIKHTKLGDQNIKKVAICGGSGSFLLDSAISSKADVFISSDFKYHEFFDADGKIIIMDIGHYESERFTIDLLYDLITEKFRKFAARCTKVNTNPVKYY